MTLMKTTKGTAEIELAAAEDLRAVMPVVLRGDVAYAKVRQIWNGAVPHNPAIFARCEDAKDVQAAMRAARAHGLPLSVRGGGHDWAGRALCHDGLVIDLSTMRQVNPHALPGGYPNFLTQDDREQLGSAYGSNASRLRDLKRQYDPDKVFSSTIPIPV